MMDSQDRAKVSVSMTDDLKQRTDAYAQQHTLSFSDVVQQALEHFFNASPAPAPLPAPPEPAPTPSPAPSPVEPLPPFDLATLRDYVLQVAIQHEYLRDGLQRAGMSFCYPLPRPPWLPTRESKTDWPPALP